MSLEPSGMNFFRDSEHVIRTLTPLMFVWSVLVLGYTWIVTRGEKKGKRK